MATISFGGLGNGLDFGQVIDQLVKAAHLPVDRLTEKKALFSAKSTDYATLSTKLAMLQSAADKLRLTSSFDRSSISTSDEAIVTATGSSLATPGTYQVQVSQLAQSHQIISKSSQSVSEISADIVSGSSAAFTFRVGTGSSQTVTLGATATLENLRDEINNLGAGVAASIINTGSDIVPAYRLVMTSTSTGSDYGITVSADDTTLDLTNGSGTGGTDTLQIARDAVVVIGSATTVSLTRSNNVVTDAISGVTMTLTDTGTVQVNVSRDITAVKSNITALATAYNDVVKFVNERNTYDIATKKGGVFFDEPTVRNVFAQIRTALSSTVSGASSLSTVGEVGFKTERDGTITVDDAKLSSVLNTSYSAVKALFTIQTGITGVAQLLTDAVDRLDDIQFGSVTLRKASLTKQMTTLTDDIASKEDALALYEERLKRQYAALDSLLRQLGSQSTFLAAGGSAARQSR